VSKSNILTLDKVGETSGKEKQDQNKENKSERNKMKNHKMEELYSEDILGQFQLMSLITLASL